MTEELKFCACNCGEKVKNNRFNFLPGHAKNLANQEPPLCACNCGERVKFDHSKNHWNKFVNNHYVPTEEAVKHISEAKIKENKIKREKRKSELGKPPLCLCGCLQPVSMDRSCNKWNDYIRGHSSRGRKASDSSRQKMSESSKNQKGAKNPFYGKTHNKETRKVLSDRAKMRVGDKSSNWKGGIHPVYQAIRNCEAYQKWRMCIFERDWFTCQKCKKKNRIIIHAHHKKEFKLILKEHNIQTLEDALACQELWDLNNGITYCWDCHIEEHKRINSLKSLNKAA